MSSVYRGLSGRTGEASTVAPIEAMGDGIVMDLNSQTQGDQGVVRIVRVQRSGDAFGRTFGP